MMTAPNRYKIKQNTQDTPQINLMGDNTPKDKILWGRHVLKTAHRWLWPPVCHPCLPRGCDPSQLLKLKVPCLDEVGFLPRSNGAEAEGTPGKDQRFSNVFAPDPR